jgi:hypothetical protein
MRISFSKGFSRIKGWKPLINRGIFGGLSKGLPIFMSFENLPLRLDAILDRELELDHQRSDS